MKALHSEVLARHAVHESCVAYREVRREELTGVCIGQPLSRESYIVQGAGAILSGADLRDAKNLAQKSLDTACGNEETLLSAGLTIKNCE